MRKKVLEIILLVVVVVIGLLSIFLLTRTRKELETYNVKNETIYYYFGDEYNEFEGKVSFDNNGTVTKLVLDGEKTSEIKTPIYFKNEKKVLLPTNYSIIRTNLNGKQNRVNYFTMIEENDMGFMIKNTNLNARVENAIFYDGVDTYLFTDEAVLTFGEDQIKLSPLSYVMCSYKNYLYIYNYEENQMLVYNQMKKEVFATTEKYKINLSLDDVTIGEKTIILAKDVDRLSLIK